MKLKAFSILELLVSIVISGIVISTAYSVYIFTHKQFFIFTSVKTELRDYFELSNVLNRDFENGLKVIKTGPQEIEILSTDRQIIYSFYYDHILRTINNHTDTFNFSVTNLETILVNEIKEEQLIANMKLTLNEDEKEKTMSFHKKYGAFVMID